MQSSNMKARAWLALPVLASLAWPLHARQDPGPDALSQMRQRLHAMRVVASTKEATASLGVRGRARLERELARADSVLEAERWLESLRPYATVADALAQHWVEFETGPLESAEEFELESQSLRDLLRELAGPVADKAKRPAALQALCEQARLTAQGYLSSSGEQRLDEDLGAAIYYLKTVRAQAELARLWTELPCEAPAQPIGEIPGLGAYLGELEAELLELYQPPLTQDRHATFIRLSAGLKFARELNGAKYQLGALEEGLAVARGLAAFADHGSADVHDRDALGRELERWREHFDGLEEDVSLPQVWLGEAEDALADETSDLADTAALLNRVLADYSACLERPEDDGSAVVEAEVTVTLVRWPFT